MKITLDQALDLLKKAGLNDVEVVEAEADSDVNIDEALSAIDDSRSEFIKPKLTDELMSQVKGKQGVYLRDTLSKITGMTRNKLNAFDTDVEAVKAALSHWEETIGKKPSELKEEMDALIAAHNAEMESVRKEYDSQLSAVNAKYNDKNINDYIGGIVAEMNLPEGADKGMIAKIVRNALSDRVDLSFDAENQSVLALKKGANTPAMNDSGTQMFDFKSAIEGALKPLGLLVEPKKEKDPVDVVNRFGNNDYRQNKAAQTAVNPSVAELNEARAKMFADANPA